MRGQASIQVRLARLGQHRTDAVLEREIAWLAAEYGLHPEEIRREAERHQEHVRRYGREPVSTVAERLAAELNLPVDEIMRVAEGVARKRMERGW